ncbi:hypothetical protein ABK249_14045 [Neorhizobium sp. Rsf11]|uniref:Uncharacterized protein n=2 Tax=Neorhizobium TaxID=1525371 RepID=A0ABV0M2I1_9HYPH|nr:hypothetical protein [Neorhizobium petrolearium]MCC2612138.1 hypothetical protein [Neorhizobium petrolearium]WGI67291.1 hypothetical protein QEO92_20110 [Neorhizobium petrolearium]
MSSNSPQESIDPVNVAMLRDVLRAAGFRGVEAEASSDAKREALVFLNSEFRNGNRTRKALLLALEHRDTGLTADPRPESSPKNEAIDRWQDEGGR